MRLFVVAALAASVHVGLAEAGTFRPLAQNSGVAALSHNGRIGTGVFATGYSGAPSWRWTPENGVQSIPDFLDAVGMNDWAQPLAGAVHDADGNEVAAVAYSNVSVVGPVVIGAYPGSSEVDGFLSSTYGVSDDGVAVGLAYDETGNPIAFRWTAADGIARLPVNRPTTFSRANGISRDGSIAFGWNDQPDGYRSGVVWKNGSPIDMTDADGNPIGEASAATADGSVVVGGGYYTANGSEAWRWTAATGAQPIGILPAEKRNTARTAASVSPATMRLTDLPATTSAPDGFLPPESYAFAVSDDGNVIVGASGVWPVRTATIWTPETGLQPLADYATAHGVTIPDHWFLAAGTAISADGKTIGGWGLDADGVMAAFIVDLRSDEPSDAVVEAHGTVGYNDLAGGPFAGIAVGTPVTLSFVVSPDGIELAPGNATSYPIRLDTFRLQAGEASETLVATANDPSVMLTNDYPMSDGIHLMSTPTASGQLFEFELFNPGGNLFDSDDLNRINRTFGPELFEKTSWQVSEGDQSFWVQLDSVSIHDVVATDDAIFANGFE
ncbi:hypothetical protein [Dokdonella sp.]|uniref:hypothetical protein n=1 Tax=Dokdonella sp. TaxID=2291710 RepID=UPI001B11E4A9|nr:hypothetical protein [Dokdonella sp.]MBO9662852.1 hypothetical protein [Dokdonella sp.]